MAVTLKDIAEKTGVSPSVVSTVLSGRDNGTFVSEQTRQKVLQVAEFLNYTPVRSGRPRGSRRLRHQREERFIGVWDPDYSPSTAFYVQNLQEALIRQATLHGASSDDDFGLRLLTRDDLPRLDAVGIMGMILLTPLLLPREAAAATIPTVMIGEADNPPREMVQVHGDNWHAGRLLGEYLWDLGHRSIAFLAPSAHPRVANRRFQGLQSVWNEHEGDKNNILPVPVDKNAIGDERSQVRHVILDIYGTEKQPGKCPTALLCSSERIAAVTLQTLAEIGLKVPGDVSVAAFGDTPRIAEDLIPPLTVVRDPVACIADTALRQLALLHEGKLPDDTAGHDFAFTGELIVRASCSSPAGQPE
jgi:LacI family transcriptional regulator